MDIHTVEAEYRETVSLPNYSNVTYGTTLRADVQEGESEMAVESDLHRIAKTKVQDRIDETLEAHGKAAKYYSGLRARVLLSRKYQAVIVLHDDSERPDDFTRPVGREDSDHLRPGHAFYKGQELAEKKDYEFFDVAGGEEEALEEYMEKMEEDGKTVEEETFDPDDEMPF